MRSVHIHNAIYLLSVTSNLSFKSAEYMHRELRGWRGGGGGWELWTEKPFRAFWAGSYLFMQFLVTLNSCLKSVKNMNKE